MTVASDRLSFEERVLAESCCVTSPTMKWTVSPENGETGGVRFRSERITQASELFAGIDLEFRQHVVVGKKICGNDRNLDPGRQRNVHHAHVDVVRAGPQWLPRVANFDRIADALPAGGRSPAQIQDCRVTGNTLQHVLCGDQHGFEFGATRDWLGHQKNRAQCDRVRPSRALDLECCLEQYGIEFGLLCPRREGATDAKGRQQQYHRHEFSADRVHSHVNYLQMTY